MTIDFRCENCGKLLSVDDQAGGAARCPHCRKKVTVPDALAALPRPHVEPNARCATAALPAVAPAPSQAGARPQEPVDDEAVAGAMTSAMPWVISAFMHLGVFLIMIFFVIVTMTPENPTTFFIPGPATSQDNLGGVMNPKTETPSKEENDKQRVVQRYPKREERVNKGKTEKTVDLLAASSDGDRGGSGELGLDNRNAPGGPEITIFGDGGNGFHVVFVIDRSGSMAPTFERVRFEMLRTIGRFKEEQDFTIILFADNQYIEGPRKGLVPAELVNKDAAADFLKDVTPSNTTTVLPALKRAFEVLKYADASKPGRLVYLLSDGDFAGMSGGSTYTAADGRALNGNEAVIQWLRDNNPREFAKGRVQVHTFLYLSKDEEAMKVMRTIARENSGGFKPISSDE